MPALEIGRRKNILVSIVSSLGVAAGVIILAIIFTVSSRYFLTTSNIYRLLQQVAVIATLSVGQAFVIFTAGIDLSQAAVLALAAVIGAQVMVTTHSIALGVLVSLAVGALAGFINGLLITKLKLVPFIGTLAMLGIASGAALLYTNGQPVFGLPSRFAEFGSNGVFIFPFIVIVAAGCACAAQFLTSETRLGRYIYAIGSNERAALVAGINVQRVLVIVYVISGLLVGIAASLQVAYVNTAQPIQDVNLELDAIAAVVIGGGSLFGGEGTIWGTMLGALLIGILDNGTELLGVSTYVQTVLLGIVVVLAVALDNVRRAARATASA